MTSSPHRLKAVALLVAVVLGHGLARRAVQTNAANAPSLTAASAWETGPELLVIYIGAEHCGFSQMPELPPALHEIVRRVERLAEEKGFVFSTVGVAIDRDLSTGMAHLEELAIQWDEAVLGRNWMNSAVIEHVWQYDGTVASTPTVLVARRRTSGPSVLNPDARVEVQDFEILERHSGVVRIGEFARVADEVIALRVQGG